MSQTNTTWEINGKTYELDVYDEETAEKYQNAFKILEKEEIALSKDGELTEQIRNYCQIFYNLFDNIFGEGAGEDILGKSRNVNRCNATYDSFLDFVKKQKIAVVNFKTEIASKYSNRQTRRAAAKKGNK